MRWTFPRTGLTLRLVGTVTAFAGRSVAPRSGQVECMDPRDWNPHTGRAFAADE